MNWEAFYLTCFLVGVALSIVSFVGGNLHLPHVHFHLSRGHLAGPHVASGRAGLSRANEMPLFNFATFTAFLSWFGGTGYLLTRHSSLLVAVIILVYRQVPLTHDHALDPADYDRVGVLGRISSSIREGGTGEIIFSQAGSRHTCGARSESGERLARGTEVIITRYERGIAYVRRWDEMADGHLDHQADDSSLT
jgi:hypothetical protein